MGRRHVLSVVLRFGRLALVTYLVGMGTWTLLGPNPIARSTVVVGVLLGVALFLFVTQKELYDSTISFVSAITAGIAILFRLLGMFQKGESGAAPQG